MTDEKIDRMKKIRGAKKMRALSIYIQAAKTLTHNLKDTGTIILLDALMIFVLASINILASRMFPEDEAALKSFLTAWQPHIPLVLLGILMYAALLIIVYSFFKYSILIIVDKCFNKTEMHMKTLRTSRKELSFSKIMRFASLNLLVLLIFTAIFAFFSFLFIMSVRIDYIVMVRNIFLVATCIIAFIYINFAQSAFLRQHLIRKSMAEAYRLTAERSWKSLQQIAITAMISAVFWAAYLGIDWALIRIFKQGYNAPASPAYTAIIVFLMFVMVTFVLTYNLFVFHLRAERSRAEHE
jgi:ABC-type transport system involved in multi-copper enzyme maturation permease subunit